MRLHPSRHERLNDSHDIAELTVLYVATLRLIASKTFRGLKHAATSLLHWPICRNGSITAVSKSATSGVNPGCTRPQTPRKSFGDPTRGAGYYCQKALSSSCEGAGSMSRVAHVVAVVMLLCMAWAIAAPLMLALVEWTVPHQLITPSSPTTRRTRRLRRDMPRVDGLKPSKMDKLELSLQELLSTIRWRAIMQWEALRDVAWTQEVVTVCLVARALLEPARGRWVRAREMYTAAVRILWCLWVCVAGLGLWAGMSTAPTLILWGADLIFLAHLPPGRAKVMRCSRNYANGTTTHSEFFHPETIYVVEDYPFMDDDADEAGIGGSEVNRGWAAQQASHTCLNVAASCKQGISRFRQLVGQVLRSAFRWYLGIDQACLLEKAQDFQVLPAKFSTPPSSVCESKLLLRPIEELSMVEFDTVLAHHLPRMLGAESTQWPPEDEQLCSPPPVVVRGVSCSDPPPSRGRHRPKRRRRLRRFLGGYGRLAVILLSVALGLLAALWACKGHGISSAEAQATGQLALEGTSATTAPYVWLEEKESVLANEWLALLPHPFANRHADLLALRPPPPPPSVVPIDLNRRSGNSTPVSIVVSAESMLYRTNPHARVSYAELFNLAQRYMWVWLDVDEVTTEWKHVVTHFDQFHSSVTDQLQTSAKNRLQQTLFLHCCRRQKLVGLAPDHRARLRCVAARSTVMRTVHVLTFPTNTTGPLSGNTTDLADPRVLAAACAAKERLRCFQREKAQLGAHTDSDNEQRRRAWSRQAGTDSLHSTVRFVRKAVGARHKLKELRSTQDLAQHTRETTLSSDLDSCGFSVSTAQDSVELDRAELFLQELSLAAWTDDTSAALAPPAADRTEMIQDFPTFQLLVKATTWHTLTINGNTSVWALKSMVEDKTGVPASRQRLVCNGKEMHNDVPVRHYGVQAESSVHMSMRICGGVGPPEIGMRQTRTRTGANKVKPSIVDEVDETVDEKGNGPKTPLPARKRARRDSTSQQYPAVGEAIFWSPGVPNSPNTPTTIPGTTLVPAPAAATPTPVVLVQGVPLATTDESEDEDGPTIAASSADQPLVLPSAVPHFSCSYAKRSAKCRKCATLIDKGDLRVINHQTDAKWDYPQHYHKLCFFARSNRINRGLLTTEQLEVTEETRGNAAWATDEVFIVQSIRKPPKIPGHLLNIPPKKAKQSRRVPSKSFTIAPPTIALQQPSEHIFRLLTHNVRTLSLGSTPQPNAAVWGESCLLGSSTANLLTFDSHYSDIGATFVGMQETRVLGQTPEAGLHFPDFKFAYHFSGPPEGEVRNFGVGLAIREEWNDTAKVHHVNDRLLWAQITMGDKTMFVVVAYAPSKLAGAFETAARLTEFYEHMDVVLASIDRAASKLGIKSPNLIILGDFNAQLGAGEPDAASAMDQVIGLHCSDRYPPSNQPATTALVEFCLNNGLKDAASFFIPGPSGTGTYHKPCDAALRDEAGTSPEIARDIYTRTIDHVLSRLSPDIETRMCSVVHPAEPLSDHRPVYIDLAVIMVPPQRPAKTGGRHKSAPKPDWSTLNCSTNAERVQRKIAEELAKLRQSCLDDAEGLEEEAFNAVKDLIRKVCVDELPPRKHVRQSPDWFEEHAAELRALINTKRVAWKRVCDVGKRPKHGKKTDVSVHRVAWQKARLAVQAACRRYKSDFWSKIAAELNIMFERNDMNGFFAAIKRTYGSISGKLDGAEGILSKDESTLHVHNDQIAGRWQEHFSELFNQCVNSNFLKFQAEFMPDQRPTALQLGTDFTMGELLKVIEEVPKGKATGADMIPNEVYKALFNVDLREMLLRRINGMLNSGVVPSSMKDVIISILYKKDDPRVCNNYRGLSLINHEGKLLERLIQNRLLKYVNSPAGIGIIPTNQFGFQPGKATTDAMWMSRLLGYLAVNKNERLLKCYIDLTKAYDRVDRDILWCILGRYGVPEKMVELIKQLHVGSVARIKLNGKVSTDSFGLNNGLKQGSVFAPLLFNVFFGSIMNNCREQFKARGLGATLQHRPDGVVLRHEFRGAKRANRDVIQMSDIAFADDVELFARSADELQAMLDIIEEVTSCFGQEVSIAKSKVLCIDGRQDALNSLSASSSSASPPMSSPSSSSCSSTSLPARGEGETGDKVSHEDDARRDVHVKIRGKELEVVSEFKYLGCWENNASDMTSELKFRLQRMQGAFHQWSGRVLLHKGVSLKARLQVFNAVIVANAVYGCPAWTMLSSQIESLESTYFSMLRRVVGCSATASRVTTMDAARAAGCEVFPLEASIIKRTLRYWGHVARLPANQLHRMVAASIPNLGPHPKLHLGEMLDNSLKAFGIPHHSWVQLAQKIPNPNPSLPPFNPWQKTVDDGVFVFTTAWIQSQLRSDRIAEAMTLTGAKQTKLIQFLDELMTTKPMDHKTHQLHQLLIDITNSPTRSTWRRIQPTPTLPISPPHPLEVFLASLRGLSKKERQAAWAEGKHNKTAASSPPAKFTLSKLPVEDLQAVIAATPFLTPPHHCRNLLVHYTHWRSLCHYPAQKRQPRFPRKTHQLPPWMSWDLLRRHWCTCFNLRRREDYIRRNTMDRLAETSSCSLKITRSTLAPSLKSVMELPLTRRTIQFSCPPR
jgi:hypothetical protein